MKIQKSFETEQGGLYIVPTPIGNLEDITFRALNILRSAHIIAAEDTRNTKKLLNHFEITTPLISYHDHNKDEREQHLMDRLHHGELVALVSDAGMPAISDPGYELVKAAIKREYPVIVLPGANAAICALVGSGLPTNEFLYYGFLPRKRKEKQAELSRLKNLRSTIIFYESPYRLKDTLKFIHEEFGNRDITIARELTKRYEEYVRGPVEKVIPGIEGVEIKGECVLVVEGGTGDQEDDKIWWGHLDVKDHVKYYIEHDQLRSKAAIKQVADERNMRRRDVYEQYHIL